jgi:hypothetical protein
MKTDWGGGGYVKYYVNQWSKISLDIASSPKNDVDSYVTFRKLLYSILNRDPNQSLHTGDLFERGKFFSQGCLLNV